MHVIFNSFSSIILKISIFKIGALHQTKKDKILTKSNAALLGVFHKTQFSPINTTIQIIAFINLYHTTATVLRYLLNNKHFKSIENCVIQTPKGKVTSTTIYILCLHTRI